MSDKQDPEDDLMAMLDDSAKEFESKLKIDEKKEEVKKVEEKPVVEAAEGKGTTDDVSMEELMKMANGGQFDPTKMGLSEDEMKQANDLFGNMMQEFGGQQNQEGQTSSENKDGALPSTTPADANANPFAKGLAGLQEEMGNNTGASGMPSMPDNFGEILGDKEFQNFFQNFTQNMTEGQTECKEGEEEGGQKEMMDSLMNEFTSFMDTNKDNSEMKNTFDDMMKQMLSKESLEAPMKQMKEAYPKYLEENADKISIEDLERYNSQLDIIEALCKEFDEKSTEEIKSEWLVDQLNKLQEYGHPPSELMEKMGFGMPGMMGGMEGMMGGMMGGMPGMPGMPPN